MHETGREHGHERLLSVWKQSRVCLRVTPVNAPGFWALSVICPQKSLVESRSSGLNFLVPASLHVLKSG